MRAVEDQELLDEIKKTYDEISGKGTPDLKVFEVMVILAWKD